MLFLVTMILPVKYIYATNELKYFYSTKKSLNIWSTKYKLESYNLAFTLYRFTKAADLKCTWFMLKEIL